MPSPNTFRVDGEHVFLTPLQQSNIRTHFRWNNDAELNRLDSEEPFQREPYGEFARRFQAMCQYATPGEHDFEVHTQGGRLIGVGFLSGVCSLHGRGRVGLTLGERDAWGQGYGREALGLMLRYGFETLDMHRVEAIAYAFNKAWRATLASAGFQREGCRRDYLHRDGRYWNQQQFALLRAEHRAQRTDRSATPPIPARLDARGDGAASGAVRPDSPPPEWRLRPLASEERAERGYA